MAITKKVNDAIFKSIVTDSIVTLRDLSPAELDDLTAESEDSSTEPDGATRYWGTDSDDERSESWVIEVAP